MKAYTDIEQSKKLMKLGIDVSTADMFYKYVLPKSDKIHYIPEIGNPINSLKWYNAGYTFRGNKEPITLNEYCIPSWSLSALLGLMPKHIKQEDGRIYKFYIFNDDGRVIQRWGCSYVAEDYHNRAEYLSDPTLKYPTNVYSAKYDNPLDAAFEMICWLLENKKI